METMEVHGGYATALLTAVTTSANNNNMALPYKAQISRRLIRRLISCYCDIFDYGPLQFDTFNRPRTLLNTKPLVQTTTGLDVNIFTSVGDRTLLKTSTATAGIGTFVVGSREYQTLFNDQFEENDGNLTEKFTVPSDMFKRSFSSDGMASNQTAAGSIPTQTQPVNVRFGLQFGHQQQPPSFSAFTPDYQHFPYTFSSITPPAYSWANTNSTHVMKFTGLSNPLPLDTSTYHPSNFGSMPKRKIDLDAELIQPPKMRITEEKVSASLRDMHISSEFKPHNYCVSSAVSDNSNVTSEMDTLEYPSLAETVNIPETAKTDSQSTLVMCEELRQLQKIDSIIPQPLLNVERPTNAVAIWNNKPLVEFVRSFSNSEEPKSTVVITEITDEDENEINNRDKMFVEENNCIAFEDDNMEL